MSCFQRSPSFFLFLRQDFITQWSLGQEAGPEEANGSQLGLAWLIPLWVDRDPEVGGHLRRL